MVVNDFKLNLDLNESSRLFKVWYSVKFELPMASFYDLKVDLVELSLIRKSDSLLQRNPGGFWHMN